MLTQRANFSKGGLRSSHLLNISKGQILVKAPHGNIFAFSFVGLVGLVVALINIFVLFKYQFFFFRLLNRSNSVIIKFSVLAIFILEFV